MGGKVLLAAIAVAVCPVGMAQAQVSVPPQNLPQPAADPVAPASILPTGTPIVVATLDDLSSITSMVGDQFKVVVVNDVIDRGIVVIPKGTTGYGEVTFSAKKGAFGRAGMLGIALRTLDLGGKSFDLDGRYREEGKDNGAAAGAVVFAVGVFGALVSGKNTQIPKGRELKAHTGEDIPYPVVGAAPVVAPPDPVPSAPPAAIAAPQPAPLQPTTVQPTTK